MNPTNDQDFAQFDGAFDFSQAPDSTFAEMLRRRMADERVHKPEQRGITLASPPVRTPQVQKPVVLPPPSRRPIWAAMAALLVVSIIGASVWQIGGLMNEGQYGTVPEVVLPADASVTPGADVELTSKLLVQMPGFYTVYNVFGDVILGNGVLSSPDGTNQSVYLYALDAQTGEELWKHQGWYVYFATWDEEYIYVLKEPEDNHSDSGTQAVVEVVDQNDTYVVEGISLVALDRHTGAVGWEYTLPSYTSRLYDSLFWSEPTIHAGVIYLTTWNTVVAVNTTDGSERWQAVTRFPSPEQTDLVGLGVSQDRVVVVGTRGYVLVLDPDSGATITHNQIDVSSYLRMNYNVYVGSNPSGVVAVFTGIAADDQEGVTVLIDPQNGDALTTVTTDASSGRNAFAEDGSVAFVPNKWNAGNRWNPVNLIFGRGSYTTFSLVWIDTVEGKVRLSTEYTRVGDSMTMVVASDGEYACYATKTLDCYDRYGTRYPVADAVLAGTMTGEGERTVMSDSQVQWAEISDGCLYYSTDDGIFVVDLP